MNIAQSILFGTLTLALHGIVNAQIYESTDAEGVPEFSDTPSAGSEVVDLQQTNIADDPPVIPEAPQAEVARPAPAPAAAPEAESPGEVGQPVYDVYGGNYNNDDVDPRERRHLDRDRVDNALPEAHPHGQPHFAVRR